MSSGGVSKTLFSFSLRRISGPRDPCRQTAVARTSRELTVDFLTELYRNNPRLLQGFRAGVDFVAALHEAVSI